MTVCIIQMMISKMSIRKRYIAEKGNVGFGCLLYDVQKFIELTLEGLGIEKDNRTNDEVKQLKKDCIGKIRQYHIATQLFTLCNLLYLKIL